MVPGATFQSSLRDEEPLFSVFPALKCWATVKRPFGTERHVQVRHNGEGIVNTETITPL